MKATLVVLAAAGLLLGVEGVRAAPAGLNQIYVAGVSAQADARLANAGVDLPGRTVKARGTLSGDRLLGARVVESTGDLAVDRAVEDALRRMRTSPVPAELAGRDITLTLGEPPIVQAKAP